MTLLKILEKQKRQYEELNVDTVSKILKRKDVTFENATFDKKYRDEIIYDLSRINRC